MGKVKKIYWRALYLYWVNKILLLNGNKFKRYGSITNLENINHSKAKNNPIKYLSCRRNLF